MQTELSQLEVVESDFFAAGEIYRWTKEFPSGNEFWAGTPPEKKFSGVSYGDEVFDNYFDPGSLMFLNEYEFTHFPQPSRRIVHFYCIAEERNVWYTIRGYDRRAPKVRQSFERQERP